MHVGISMTVLNGLFIKQALQWLLDNRDLISSAASGAVPTVNELSLVLRALECVNELFQLSLPPIGFWNVIFVHEAYWMWLFFVLIIFCL